MPMKTVAYAAFLLFLASSAIQPAGCPGAFTWSSAQATGSSPAPTTASPPSVSCRVMEVFAAEPPGATVVIFHQRVKADGPRLGGLLLAHNGREAEFETDDGKRHRAKAFRVKSCFGRGMLVFAAGETKLAEGDDFVLRFP
jgi:hypothetical protein